jgi:hypothetical protein
MSTAHLNHVNIKCLDHAGLTLVKVLGLGILRKFQKNTDK